jgi:hypothetical protein
MWWWWSGVVVLVPLLEIRQSKQGVELRME